MQRENVNLSPCRRIEIFKQEAIFPHKVNLK